LIVGILAFTLQITRRPSPVPQIPCSSEQPAPPIRFLRKTICAKRNRASHPLLSGKRFYATEDLKLFTDQLSPVGLTAEVMHPSSIS
jgi:hypothetical protein